MTISNLYSIILSMTAGNPEEGIQPQQFPSMPPSSGEGTLYGGTPDQVAAAREAAFFRTVMKGLPGVEDPRALGREAEVTPVEPLSESAAVAAAAEESNVEGSLSGVLAKHAGATLLSSARAIVARLTRRTLDK